MSAQYENVQNLGKEHVERTLKSFSVLTKGLQGIAAELADYSKRSIEEGSGALQKLASAKSLDKALEIQTEYARNSYQEFVAESTKVGELYKDLAREAFKPYEGFTTSASTR